jgi:hypothetical protein
MPYDGAAVDSQISSLLQLARGGTPFRQQLTYDTGAVSWNVIDTQGLSGQKRLHLPAKIKPGRDPRNRPTIRLQLKKR